MRGVGPAAPEEMTTTMPERPRWSADDPATRPPVRAQASVTVGCGVAHTFSPSDFDASGESGAGLVAVVVVGLEREGVLSLRGSPVMLNEVVPMEKIAASTCVGEFLMRPIRSYAGRATQSVTTNNGKLPIGLLIT